MARASAVTLLSLDDFAKVMGINPAHFNGAANSNVTPVVDNACNDIWPQYSWQAGDRVSREDIAQEIANTEQDIADYIKYFPAPMWIAQENHPYPRHHRPDVISVGGYDVRGYHKSVNTKYGYIIAPGQRAVTDLGDSNVTLSDADKDTYKETATVSIATTLTDECEIKVYFSGHGGEQEWEIRPARTKAISGGIFTATFWAWQLIDPKLWEALPTVEGFAAIDWTDSDNIVDSVEIYREYNDTTATTAEFYWEPKTIPLNWQSALNCGCGGVGCEACTLTTQTGCLHIRDAESGIAVPEPASYSSGVWGATSWSVCRDPDFVKIWYYAGYWSDRKRRSEVCEPLSRWWHQIIAYMATARLERPFCSCHNLTALAQWLREDLSMIGETVSYATPEEILSNPFGTKRGEVMAWSKLSKLTKKRMIPAVV